jgi:hypothetical protein
MTRMLRTALLATVLMALAAPTALADSTKWDRSRTLDCGDALSLTVVLPPSAFRPAIVPFHVEDSTAILVPFWLRVTSTNPEDLWVWDARSKPFVAQHADRLISCEYTDEDGLFIEIVGMLTPAS